MYLLDTNICIALLKENPQAVKKLNRYFSQCYVSTINDILVTNNIKDFTNILNLQLENWLEN